jgi:hypothetical protein
MNRLPLLLGLSLCAVVGLSAARAAGGYEALAEFENLWHQPPLAPDHSNGVAGVAFGGHSGPYRFPGSSADPVVPATPNGRFQLVQSSFGQPFEGRRPDFQLGQVITPLPGVNVDSAPVIEPPTAAFYVPSRKIVIAADSGLVRITWPLSAGGTQERNYLISAVPEKRPARIFWTEEPYNAPTVSLRDRFTTIHYNTKIGLPVEDTSKTNQPLKQFLKGLWEDEQHILHAKDVTGMVILEFFETGERIRQVGWEVVEVAAPSVHVQNVYVGQRLLPVDTSYGGSDLRAEIRKGLPKLVYKHATRTPDGPKNEWVFAIARTVDQPYQIEMYWKHQGVMEVEWPFELDWYAADWPPDSLTQVYVRGGGSSNAPVVIPRELQVKLEDFQEPAQHAKLDNNDAGEWVFSTTGPGHALLRYSANESVWFQAVRSVDHTNADLFNQAPLPWIIGKEIQPVRAVNALRLQGANSLDMPLGAVAGSTIECWLRPEQNMNVHLLSKVQAADPAQRSLQLDLTENQHLRLSVWADGSSVPIQIEGQSLIKTGVWQHVALSLATNGPVRLFVNGAEDAEPARVGRVAGDTLIVGGPVTADGLPGYAGELAELRVWTRLVSPSELGVQSQGRLLGQPNGLDYYLNFESYTATAVNNKVGGVTIPVQGDFTVAAAQLGDISPQWSVQPGYVHAPEGDRYNDRLYAYPSETSHVFPVNTGVLEVWWPRENRQDGMPVGVFWPSLVCRYQGTWDPQAPELIIAGQNSNPVGVLGPTMGDPSVYYQNDPARPGYNPNEEHALILAGRVYAIRNDLNSASSSLSYVLVQYKEAGSAQPKMASFHVLATNEVYQFSQELLAGALLQPPMPLTVLPKASASRLEEGPAWRDRKLEYWAMAAGADGISPANIVLRFFYPVQTGFDFPGESKLPAPGTEVPWLSGEGPRGVPVAYHYTVRWPDVIPVLQMGETLSKAKGGMPAILGQKSVRVIYEQSKQQPSAMASVSLIDPTQARSIPLDAVPDDIATEIQRGKKYFPTLPPHLRNRLYFDPDAKLLTLIGEFVEPPAGESFLQLNVLSEDDLEVVKKLSNDLTWGDLVKGFAHDVVSIANENTPFDSLALSAALAQGTGFVTIAFNNSTNLNEPPDPISLAIIRIDPKLYRGEIKVVSSDNPLDEQLTLQHSGDFAGDASRYEFEWRTLPPNDSGMPPENSRDEWTRYDAGDNKPRVVIHGPGLFTLTDNYFVCRYRPKGTSDTGWSDWTEPMLAEGWIKRALNGINPFEQRISDLQDNAINTTVSMISQAGPRWVGDVPLNLDNINDFGLIEIYETILKRGRMLSVDSGFKYAPANDALLLAAGRIHDLYMILGNEAYADANDPTVAFSTSDRAVYAAEWTSLFCFMNQLPTLLDEELSLLRGRDDSLLPSVRTYPIYNRLIWNFTKGLNGGEAAYALNYNVRNEDNDERGSITEGDAKRLYPQGHGDAWGHYLTAIKAYYSLLANTNFEWVPRIESKLVGGVPVSVDYYDERKFAEAAAARARTGIQVMGLTHRQLYKETSESASAGFRDDHPDRAWGLTEWGSRIGQAALFDWAVANSLLPDKDTNAQHVGIQVIDRTTVPELKEVVTAMEEVQKEMDYADKGLNPLGLDKNTVPFDIDPAGIDAGKTHFEQLYERALTMVNNAARILANAQDKVLLLRRQADSLEDLRENVSSGEDDYNNQLIEIFGFPYPNDIGPGKTYPQGYDGPDLYHYQYVDVHDLIGSRMPVKGTTLPIQVYNYEFTFSTNTATTGQSLAGTKVRPLNVQLNTNSVVTMSFYVADNGLVIKPPEWKSTRRAQGEVQLAYSDFLLAWYDLETSLRDYNALLGDIVDGFGRLDARVDQFASENSSRTTYGYIISAAEVTSRIATSIADDLSESRNLMLSAMSVPKESIPQSFIAGLAAGGDVMAPARGAIKAAEAGASTSFSVVEKITKGVAIAADITKAVTEGILEDALRGLEQDADLLETRLSLQQTLRQQAAKQTELQGQLERLAQAQERYRGALVRGERLISERTGFRAQAATAIQADRYADMAFRYFRNDALGRYQAAFDLAARYVYLAAKAYAYETGMRLGEPGSPSSFLEDVVNARTLGILQDGQPLSGGTVGDPGLADVLARLDANWNVLKGRLGFNNPAREASRVSLRAELFRIGSPEDPSARASSDTTWRNTLWSYKVDNLLEVPEFRRYCLPFAPLADQEPALVIPFATTIEAKKNLFGWDLAGGDHTYDSSHFATKIRAVGVWFSNFNAAFGGGLGFAPRVYLIPVGDDLQRDPTDALGQPRVWRVVDQALPVPYNLETGTLDAPDWLPIIDGLTEGFATIRKYPSLRAYHDAGTFDPSEITSNARLVGRSVWNTRWLLIIPASTLHSDTTQALDWFINGINGDGNGVKDIKLLFQTYSFSGN